MSWTAATVRGEWLEGSMSRYLIEQLEPHSNITGQFRTRVVAARGDDSLEAIEISDGSGRPPRLDSGGRGARRGRRRRGEHGDRVHLKES